MFNVNKIYHLMSLIFDFQLQEKMRPKCISSSHDPLFDNLSKQICEILISNHQHCCEFAFE
eukprot:GAHX01007735.1.p1 GENE.GAHX01007735.1~~GAHX01007735.1.p1  ORF type:complete len:61 (-),score=3.14 GAHX01007735.1:253-435(-)